MERNLRLDYFRLLLSILVITIHIQPLLSTNSLIGWLISNGIARIAVPCFFIISGYYINLRIDNKEAIKKYLLHILFVYCVWTIIYLPIYYQTTDLRLLITIILTGYYHLWFLPALIVGMLMLIIIRTFIKSDNFILIIGFVLFLAGYLIEYNQFLSYRFFCNGIFLGFPFISLGYYIQRKSVGESAKNIYLYILILVCTSTLLMESYFSYKIELFQNFFLSLYILCPVLFICILKNSSNNISFKLDISKLSAGIYYVHIWVIEIFLSCPATNNIYKLPLITIVSILLSIFIVIINKRIKIFL